MRRGMFNNDQRKLLTTGIGVVPACVLAWYLLVDHNPPRQQVQVARQIKHSPGTERKRPGAEVASQETPDPRPLPPPEPVIKPELMNLPPLEVAKQKTATETLPAD